MGCAGFWSRAAMINTEARRELPATPRTSTFSLDGVSVRSSQERTRVSARRRRVSAYRARRVTGGGGGGSSGGGWLAVAQDRGEERMLSLSAVPRTKESRGKADRQS